MATKTAKLISQRMNNAGFSTETKKGNNGSILVTGSSMDEIINYFERKNKPLNENDDPMDYLSMYSLQ